MSKYGLITFHASNNCGSILQAFALQVVLRDKLQVENEIIDFSNQGQKDMYKSFWKITGFKSFVKNALWFSVYSKINKQNNDYEKFRRKYLTLSTHSFDREEELKCLNTIYDKFITGSDQVWNIKCMDADKAYFLSFADSKKRNAYAVSFGANNPFVTCENEYYNLVRSFKKISVREHNGANWIKRAIGRDVQICLDPTMLLNQDEWENYIEIGEEPIIEGEYIFYYCFNISQKIASFLHKTSRKTGLPVYFLEPKEWALRCCWKNNIKLVDKYGPESFLNLMKYSKLIFTTSFHGTAFSTIFHKNFWYIDSGNNDLSKDDRAVSFLSQLGLMNRYKTISYLQSINVMQAINYYDVESKVNNLIDSSIEYLRGIVND